MLRKLVALAVLCVAGMASIPAEAQSFSIVELPGGCGTGNYENSLSYLTVDSQLKLCVNATVSASITGFPGTSQSTGTPISVTSSGVTGTLPAGAVVVASNVGATNGAYCKLGASATTSDQLIPPDSWFAFTVGTNTQLTCITSTSTTTVNMVGGSGLPTGSGGGGGGGSSSNASVSATGSAVPASATYFGMIVAGNLTGVPGTANGLKVDGSAVTQPVSASSLPLPTGASTAANQSTEITSLSTIATNSGTQATAANQATGNTSLATIATNSGLPVPVNVNGTGTALTGVTPGASQTGTKVAANMDLSSIGGTAVTPDPCQTGTKLFLPITSTSSAVKVIATGAASKKTYICQIVLSPGAADNVAVFEATTATTCATSPVAVYGAGTAVASAANGFQFAANGGVSLGNGGFMVGQTTVNNNDLCIGTSSSGPLAGGITYVQQ